MRPRTARRTRPDRSEGGFTLPEMLVSLVILGILFSVLTGAVIIGLRTTRDIAVSTAESNAEQLLSVYVTRDVQSAEVVLSDTDDDATLCGGPSELMLDSPATDRTVHYQLRPGSSGADELVRRVCTPRDGAGIEIVIADRVLEFVVPPSGDAQTVVVVLTQQRPDGSTGISSTLVVDRRPG